MAWASICLPNFSGRDSESSPPSFRTMVKPFWYVRGGSAALQTARKNDRHQKNAAPGTNIRCWADPCHEHSDRLTQPRARGAAVWGSPSGRANLKFVLKRQAGEGAVQLPVAIAAKECDKIAMQYRRFGQTELAMPVISCGGMRYQFKWQDVAPGGNSRRTTRPIWRPRFIARWNWGSTTSKPRAATALRKCNSAGCCRKLPRDKIIVQTKVAPQADAEGVSENL